MSAGVDYAAYASRVRDTGLLWDPWLDGAPRLSSAPLVLAPARWREFADAAEAIGAVHAELAQLVMDDARLLEEFFAPTPAQRAMWLVSAPHWHGIARADVFATAQGPRVCELNSDTPSGEAEAVVMSALAAAGRPQSVDPNAGPPPPGREHAACSAYRSTTWSSRPARWSRPKSSTRCPTRSSGCGRLPKGGATRPAR